ncbi:DUF3289 family protein [Enterobacter huaxiensis]|uniref:DUF3289 family protein n=1 Tax=Enterobacter huaxiensis TaxID=2494702 RepID=UPI00217585ED|nr:DUF3289 family protein [Enterobacter huaxiensis]MCS5450221.1 DUF3289 family protein [Enterobacter huaxiensis]
MYEMNFPCEILFQTKNRINDASTDDMQHSDLSAVELQLLGLNDVSTIVDLYSMSFKDNTVKYLNAPLITGYSHKDDQSVTPDQCASILFDEMRELSGAFASGQYKNLIGEMINHFQHGDGRSFGYNSLLNRSFSDLLRAKHYGDTTLGVIRDVINKYVSDRRKQVGSQSFIWDVQTRILRTTLPKFNDLEDRFNGMGITVHDIYFQRIVMLNFRRYQIGWEADILVEAQDHFGLGREDITKKLYQNFRFFRIWFVLQRYNCFSFKPFLTNFNASVKLTGQ